MELIIVATLLSFIVIAIAALIPVVKTIAPIYPYSYANARIRGMMSSLITVEEFEELLRKPYSDIIYQLERRDYPGLSKFLGANFSFASVDSALRSSLISTLSKIKQLSPQETQPFVKALLSKYDVQLIQSLLRTSKAKYPVRRDTLHITEVFSEEFLAKPNHGVEDVFNELKGTMYEGILAQHLEELKKGQLLQCEIDLDTKFYQRLLRSTKTAEARQYVKLLIDMQNISLNLKGLEPVIPGGKIPLDELSKQKDLQELSRKLSSYNYDVASQTEEQLEKSMQLHLQDAGKAFMAKNPLSEATIIGFLVLKTVNIRNLTILLKMKYHKYDANKIREVLAL